MLKSSPFRRITVDSGNKNISGAVPFVPHLPLWFERCQVSPNRRIARRIRLGLQNLSSRRAAAFVKNVQDLPLSSAEFVMPCKTHGAGNLALYEENDN